MNGTSLTLADYAGDPYEYTLDLATGVYVRYPARRDALRPEVSGYASIERLRDPVRGNGKVLVALYSDGERLLFSIHNEVFVISDRHVRIEKEKPWFRRGARRIQIIDRERTVFDALFTWSWLELST